MIEYNYKPSLISLMHQYVLSLGLTSYTIEQATSDLENGLETGIVRITGADMYMLTPEVIYAYNQMTGSNIEYEVEYAPDNVIPKEIEREIDIQFESTASQMQLGNAVNTYRTHPAFWWDNNSNGNVDSGETVAGIWVGKFETNSNTDSTCYTNETEENCMSSNVSPRIVPNVKSLRYQNVSNQFLTSQKFSANDNIYGLSHASTNAHMMKNSEWGAVAYLSHSKYGINSEIRINNNSNYITGCGASVENSEETIECEIPYNSESIPQSTTGNITGIFDMSGGAEEYVMGVLADSNGNPRSGFGKSYNSGFNGLFYDDTSYTSGINFPASKYYDLYTGTSAMDSCNGGPCYGHALFETANWYYSYDDFLNLLHPWFVRGGGYSEGAGAGAFSSRNYNGSTYYHGSWRSVLVVGYGA